MNETYIIIVDSGSYSYFLKNIPEVFNPKQIIHSTEGCTTSSILSAPEGSGLNEIYYSLTRAYNNEMAPVLLEANKRGYPPNAIIGCPYYTNILLRGVRDYKGLLELGFNGPITLMLTSDEASYRQNLPLVFAQNVVACLDSLDGMEENCKTIIHAIEAGGVERIRPGFVNTFDRVRNKSGFPPLGC